LKSYCTNQEFWFPGPLALLLLRYFSPSVVGVNRSVVKVKQVLRV